MMRTCWLILATCVVTCFAVTGTRAQQSGDWQPAGAAELQQALSGRGLDAPDFADYYRSDGAMGYYNKAFGTVVVRKWEVQEDGEICTYIYVKPDRLVECYTMETSTSSPDLYRLTITDRGYSVTATLVDEILPELVVAVEETAGPAD